MYVHECNPLKGSLALIDPKRDFTDNETFLPLVRCSTRAGEGWEMGGFAFFKAEGFMALRASCANILPSEWMVDTDLREESK